MNQKHLALIVVIILILGIVQIAAWLHGRLGAVQTEGREAQAAVEALDNQLRSERAIVAGLQSKTRDMLGYLSDWEPHFGAINTADSGEINVGARIKESGIVGLSQRYEVIAHSGSTNIPRILRAHLTFEDDYARTLNWLGNLESGIPTIRITRVRLSRGQSGNDLKMELIVDVPLITPPRADS